MDNSIKNEKRQIIFNKFLLFIIAVTIGLNNIVVGYKIAGISIDRIIQLFTFFLLFRCFISDLKNPSLKKIQSFVAVLFYLSLLKYCSLFIQGENIELSDFLRSNVRVIMYGVFIYLNYYLFNNDLLKVNRMF